MFRRILAALIIIALSATLLVLVWPQLFSLQRVAGIAQLVSFRGAAAAAAAVVFVVFLVLATANRSFRRLGLSLAALALVFALLNTAVLASRGFGGTPLPARVAADLTVMSWNTLGDAPGPEAIAQLAIDSDADVVSLPETTEKTAKAVALLMTTAGLPMTSHTVAHGRISKSRSTSVLISTTLGAYHLDKSAGSTVTFPTLVMVPDSGSGPTIVAAHPGGDPERYLLEMRGVPMRSTIAAGTLIVTSGLGGTFPRGIPVGVVSVTVRRRMIANDADAVASPG